MALAGVELDCEPDALTTRPPPCATIDFNFLFKKTGRTKI